MEEQSIDLDKVSCPECNGEVTEESKIKHNLGKVGYNHDDIAVECSECGHSWPHGVPIGSPPRELYEYLVCDVCDDGLMFPHRIHQKPNQESGDKVDLDLKCPNCYYFKTVTRQFGERRRILYGYPEITGSLKDANPFGYRSQKVLNTIKEDK